MTASISISGISIHQDNEGRYSLNDLHKAAGSESHHAPAQWLRLEQVNELIREILNMQICTFNPVDSRKGRYGGTYVCKELVYSYAMWISAAFSLKVIRAYDALINVVKAQESKPQTTTNDRTPLRDAINMLVGKKGLMYPEAYTLIHQRFDVTHIDELAPSQIPQAIEYVHRLALEGELLERGSSQPSFVLTSINQDGDWVLRLRDGRVESARKLGNSEFVLSTESFKEISERAGNIIIGYDKLRQMNSEQITSLISNAEKHHSHWKKIHSMPA